MFDLLRSFRIVKEPPMEWSAQRSVVEGHLHSNPDLVGAWQLVGQRRDFDAKGAVVGELPIAVDVGASSQLEVQAQDGTWIAGVVEFGRVGPRQLGYTLKTQVGRDPAFESLESLAGRDALVRLVR